MKRRWADPEAAYTAYLKAHRHLENLRSHLKAEEMKIAFLKDKLEVYEALVRMCLGRERFARPAWRRAFGYIEQAKSRSLADLIAFRSQGLPASRKTERALVEQVNTLRGELNWYSRTIQLLEGRAANLMAPQLVKLRRAARDCEQRLVEALARLRVEDAEYASLQTAGSRTDRSRAAHRCRRERCCWSTTAWATDSTSACSRAAA